MASLPESRPRSGWGMVRAWTACSRGPWQVARSGASTGGSTACPAGTRRRPESIHWNWPNAFTARATSAWRPPCRTMAGSPKPSRRSPAQTLGRSRTFDTPVGLFSFTRVPQRRFLAGVRRVSVDGEGKDGGAAFFPRNPAQGVGRPMSTPSGLRLAFRRPGGGESARRGRVPRRADPESCSTKSRRPTSPAACCRFLTGLRKELRL